MPAQEGTLFRGAIAPGIVPHQAEGAEGDQKRGPGLATAWCSWLYTPTGIATAFNVVKVVDNGVGDLTFHFATEMPSDKYTVIAWSFGATPHGTMVVRTRKTLRVLSYNGAGALATPAEVHFAVFGPGTCVA